MLATLRKKRNPAAWAGLLLMVTLGLCILGIPLACLFTFLFPRVAESPRVLFTNNYVDAPVDQDGNGRYDYLTVQVEVNAILAGNYSATADLTANGRQVSHTGAYATLASGLNTVTLKFSGNDIRASHVNGPYTLTHLAFLDTKDPWFETSADNVWATRSYNARSFGICYFLDASVEPLDAGSFVATPAPDCLSALGAQYSANTTVTLSANVNKGFTFLAWTGDIVYIDNRSPTISFPMNRDQTIMAAFMANESLITKTPTLQP